MIWDRVTGDAQRHEPHDVYLSYLSPWLVEQLPVVIGADTGPGGIHYRMEEHGLGPLVWDDRVGAHVPSARELWALAPGTPVLRVIRIARSVTGQV